jgi:hypothetical protein
MAAPEGAHVMTYDKLLAKINEPEHWFKPFLDIRKALLAVVELHKPYPSKPHKPEGVLLCRECTDYSTANWPCSTIQAIEKELI